MRTKEEIKEEILENEITEDELRHRYVACGRSKKAYEQHVKAKVKQALLSDYATVDGITISVADKLAIKMVKGLLEKEEVTPDDLIGVQKLTGEYTEKKEVGVSGIEQFLSQVTDKEEF